LILIFNKLIKKDELMEMIIKVVKKYFLMLKIKNYAAKKKLLSKF